MFKSGFIQKRLQKLRLSASRQSRPSSGGAASIVECSQRSLNPRKRTQALLVALVGICGPALPAAADSINVTYAATNVSGSTYSYIYTLSGTLATGDLLAIYFPAATSSNLVDASSTDSTFTTSVLAPDSSIPADGEYDVLANAATSTFSGTFADTFTYSGSGTPSAQSFTLYDSSYAPIATGTTTATAATTTATAVTPEPSSLILLALGLGGICVVFRKKLKAGQLAVPAAGAGLTLGILMLLPGAAHAQSGAPPTGTSPGSGGGGTTTTTSGTTLTGLTIGAYTLQSSYRVSTYQYDYTYTTSVTNANNTPYSLVLGTVTSSNANTVIVAGNVEFGSLPAVGSTSGLTTFTIRQDRRYAFSPSNLSWSFTGTSTTSVGTTASSILLTASPTSASYGSGVTLTSTVPAAATGTITFFDGPVPLGTATPTAGTATLSGVVLPTGTHNVSAAYSGDTTYAASSSSIDPLTVTAAGAVTNCSGLAETPLVVCLANAFEATLTSTQLSTVQLTYTLAHAEQWSNLPGVTRNGLAFSSLTSTQLAAALQLAQAATSSQGYQRIQNIRGGDNVLNTYSGNPYGSGNYYIALLGTPSTTSPWQLQVGGHHLAYNHTFNGTYASSTPYFIGTEPTIYNVAGTLYMPLETQRAAAYALTKSIYGNSSALLSGTFDDVVEGVNSSTSIDTNYPQTYPTTGRGLLYSSLTQAQKLQVKTMIEAWVNDSDSTTSAALLAFYESDASLAQTYVGYAGTGELASQGDYIRIDGPRVWIEFVVQDGVVFRASYHFHSIWRDKTADYGGDFLS